MPHLCWSIVLLLLSPQHTLQANPREDAEDCREYCLQCGGTDTVSPQARLGTMLQVSLQVTARGELPNTRIIVHGSNPVIRVKVNTKNSTLLVKNLPVGTLSLATPRPAFSWVNLVLARPDNKSLLVYAPEDRLSVLTAKAIPGDLVVVSNHEKIHVAFNCILGCLIRDQNSALVGGGGNEKGMEGEEEGEGNNLLRPPFTLYLKPALTPSSERNSTPFLNLTSSNGFNETVNASKWKADTWHRVEVLVGGNKTEVDKMEEEVKVWVPDGRYRITSLQFLNWTLHCPPHGLKTNPGPTQGPSYNHSTKKPTPITTQAPGGNTEGTEGGEGGEGGEEIKSTGMQTHKGGRRRGPRTGEVAAWVLAGLALLVVMILALALCTKTVISRNTHSQNIEDFPPSVGVLSFNDIKTREPEESSEPRTPTLTSTPKRPLSNW